MEQISSDSDPKIIDQCHDGQCIETRRALLLEWSSSDESNAHRDSQLRHTSSADSTVIVLAILAASDETSNVCGATTAYFGILDSKSPLKSEKISLYHHIEEKLDINASFDTQSLRGLAFINSYDVESETNSLLMSNHSGADSDVIVSKQSQRRPELELPNESIKPTVPIHLNNYQSNHRTVENSLQKRIHDRIPEEVRFYRDNIHQRVPSPRTNTGRFRVKVPTDIKVYQRG